MEAVLTSAHSLCFGQKCVKYQNVLFKKFQFLELKFSIYLNRHVFIMAFFGAKITKRVLNTLCFYHISVRVLIPTAC